MGVFFNTGQVCVARSRMFVHKNVYDRVVEGVAAHVKYLKVGPGLAPDSVLGPVVSEAQLSRIQSYIGSGAEEGAEIISGGNRIGDKGYFVEPTILAGVRPDMKVMRDGHPLDYDTWRQMGCTGWGYKDVLPYFRRMETRWRGNGKYHGADGPVALRAIDTRRLLHESLMQAAAAGYQVSDDINARSPKALRAAR